MSNAEVKFSIPVPTLDALRRIAHRDYLRDLDEQKRIMELPEAQRSEPLRELMRRESDRSMVERALGFDSTQNERGQRK